MARQNAIVDTSIFSSQLHYNGDSMALYHCLSFSSHPYRTWPQKATLTMLTFPTHPSFWERLTGSVSQTQSRMRGYPTKLPHRPPTGSHRS